jgi:hypothetical protein
MKPIESYCNTQVAGWHSLPVVPGQASFVNIDRGIHLVADVKDLGALKTIHLSLTPIPSIAGHPSVIELVLQTPQIIQDFFGDRGFAMQPIDDRNPTQRHYFSILKEDEE